MDEYSGILTMTKVRSSVFSPSAGIHCSFRYLQMKNKRVRRPTRQLEVHFVESDGAVRFAALGYHAEWDFGEVPPPAPSPSLPFFLLPASLTAFRRFSDRRAGSGRREPPIG